MNFGKIKHIILLGGSRCTYELALYLKKNTNINFNLFTAPRQLDDCIFANHKTFEHCLIESEIQYSVTDDINTSKEFLNCITEYSLALGLGEAWTFEKNIIKRFDGRLIDLMGIRLPQYRGGAHYTWQILRGNKIGACNLQIINEEMIQGVFDSGEIIKFKEYLFPTDARTPEDYFAYATSQEIKFIIEFIDEVAQGFTFNKFKLQENFSIYFPRLNTIKNAFIDWSWNSVEIERFICAFDDPYVGSATQINGKLVRLKKARFESNDGPFHPFQFGLIYKKYNNNIYIASYQGTIIISQVYDEFNNCILDELKIGDRFITPIDWIQKGLLTKIEY